MKRKDIIKLILTTFLNLIIFLCCLWAGVFFSGSMYGFMLWGLFGIVMIFMIIGFCYPIWFKEYIKEYWEKHESKDM